MRIIFAILVGFFIIPAATAFAKDEPKDPLKIVVSLEKQHMTVYRGEQAIASSPISSGKAGHETPTGIFSVMEKHRHHKSNIYSNAPMPFMQRLTWSGIALHAGHLPGYPASHGCIRMPEKFADKLFSMRTQGVHVVIEDSPLSPRRINHEALFQPADTKTGPSNRLDPAVLADDRPVRIFITRRTNKDDIIDTQRILNRLGYNVGAVDGIAGPATRSAIAQYRAARGLPVKRSIDNTFLDMLYLDVLEMRPPNGKLEVRKRQRTVYEAPVIIRDPHLPLGSHLFTTANFDENGRKTDWTVTSLADRVQRKINLRTSDKLDHATYRQSPEDTLSRIKVYPFIRDDIAHLLTPGSSVTISDNGMSEETGEKGTDFIVITKPGALQADRNLGASQRIDDNNTGSVKSSAQAPTATPGMTVVAGE